MSNNPTEINNRLPIDNTIDPNDLWKGIGGHFDSLNQILHELIDNSISNFRCNSNLPHHTILIHIDTEKFGNKFVEITIEDTGSGISNINSAFTLGDKNSQQTPLNEHGFGLKHALASSNPTNDSWKVYTRNQENVSNNKVIEISSPYKLQDFSGEKVDYTPHAYPSRLGNINSGTIIQFKTSKEMYNSLGKYGAKDVRSIALYLKEDLGFIYSGIIKDSIAEIQITINSENKQIVNAVEPWVEKTISPGVGKTSEDLGLLGNGIETGSVTISYEFTKIRPREATTDNEKVIYYQPNMKSSGIEIRLNGRMIKNNLLNEIWSNLEQHNRFNNFLGRINLISDNSASLPSTRSSKNGFRQADPKLIGLFRWIMTHCPEPYENKNNRDEVQLFEDLKNIKEKQLTEILDGSKLSIELNKRILKYSNESIRLDFFVAYNDKQIIYIGKKGVSAAIDLYKLKLYWDACIIDGLKPTSAVLLATEHNPTMHDLVSMNNSLKDFNGNAYKFVLKKWKDEGVNYPNNEL